MKKLLLTILVALPLMASAQTAPSNVTIAHYNIQVIIPQMPEYTAAVAELQTLENNHRQELNRINNIFQANLQAFYAAADSLPRNIADRRQKEIQEESEKVRSYQQFADSDLQMAETRLFEPIYIKVNDAVKAIGDTENYTYIFDLMRTQIPYIGKNAIDITDKIIARLGITK